MNLYAIKPESLGIDRMKEFLKDNFVSIGYPGLGDLEKTSKEEIQGRLADVSEVKGYELVQSLEEIEMFVHRMQDGDYVLVPDSEFVYLGDVGDYFYVESSDSDDDGTCHRRGVTWLKSVPLYEMNAFVREWLAGSFGIAGYPFSTTRLEEWILPLLAGAEPNAAEPAATVDPDTIREALDILKQALRSEDPDRRERAAAAILRYARP
ncbi:hypothetical protein [Cohnella terricola]|uniref:Uncharacterized protein n=1 Tax=Cohnella terricola TaxID=1289167 RepID=A0A559JNH0_9BACL|nr:hypothetical protein [Cohnella terricola]TVY01421.1 hypothetical protein FPZ45_09810 [Cohnella terricola]